MKIFGEAISRLKVTMKIIRRNETNLKSIMNECLVALKEIVRINCLRKYCGFNLWLSDSILFRNHMLLLTYVFTMWKTFCCGGEVFNEQFCPSTIWEVAPLLFMVVSYFIIHNFSLKI